MRFFSLILTFFLFSTQISWSQNTILRVFRAYPNGNEIVLDWVIKGGNTCNGIIIKRARADSNFQIIGEIAGVCGDNNYDEPYSFIDSIPLVNEVNFYYLEFGGNGYSEIVKVEFWDFDNQAFIRSGNSLRFDLPYQRQTLQLINFQGKTVFETTISEVVELPSHITSKPYILLIYSKNQTISYKKKIFFME